MSPVSVWRAEMPPTDAKHDYRGSRGNFVKYFTRNKVASIFNRGDTVRAHSTVSKEDEADSHRRHVNWKFSERVMKISGKKVNTSVWVYLAAAIGGLGGFAAPVGAQTAVSASGSGELAIRVQTALHADPYFYDKHVTVSEEHGAVVLRGFVLSSLDLQDALRIARKAAGDNRVVDDLTIELNGQSGRH